MKNIKGDYEGLADLTDGKGNKINLSDFTKKEPNQETKPISEIVKSNSLPEAYKDKDWDELYKSDELETIRTQHPEHYEKMRKEKFKTNY
jgi:hypothetical protein